MDDSKYEYSDLDFHVEEVEQLAPLKSVMLFYIITTIIAYSIWIPMALHKLEMIYFPIPIIIGQSVGGFSPLLTTIIFGLKKNSKIDSKTIFTRSKGRKISPLIYVMSISLFPLVAIIIAILNYILQIEVELAIINPEVFHTMGFYVFLIMPVLFLAGNLSSPLLEEPGWRGVGIHNLQPRLGKVLGSLFVGSYWWIWHLPLWIAIDIEISVFSYLILVAQSFIIDSLYMMSKQKIFVAMFLHSSQITTFTLFRTFSSNWMSVIVLWSIAIIFMLVELISQKKPKLSVSSSIT